MKKSEDRLLRFLTEGDTFWSVKDVYRRQILCLMFYFLQRNATLKSV